jgi:hypothetical protein
MVERGAGYSRQYEAVHERSELTSSQDFNATLPPRHSVAARVRSHVVRPSRVQCTLQQQLATAVRASGGDRVCVLSCDRQAGATMVGAQGAGATRVVTIIAAALRFAVHEEVQHVPLHPVAVAARVACSCVPVQ